MYTYRILAFLFLLATLSGCSESQMDKTLGSQSETESESNTYDVVPGTISKKQAQWRDVTTLRGEKSAKSKHFAINGDEWKIKWKTLPGQGEFIIILHDKNSSYTEYITSTDVAEENLYYMKDAGEYYLQIESERPYEIEIEEYR